MMASEAHLAVQLRRTLVRLDVSHLSILTDVGSSEW